MYHGVPFRGTSPIHMLIIKNTEELPQTVAEWLIGYANQVLQRQDRFTIALSGGNTPKALHQLMASAPYRNRVDWSKWHFFWGDERVVPLDDERNNAHMAYETLLNHVPIRPGQIHVMRTDIEPLEAAKEYEYLLRATFENQPTTFDLVLLGMGDDGHTLSLFPGMDLVNEQENWVRDFWLESQKMYRITLTTPVVNRAACIVFLVSGSEKAATLKEVLQGETNLNKYPSQAIQPELGELIWFVDETASSMLTDQ